MKKIKLLKSIAPILGAGMIASAIAPLCSCKFDSDEEHKKPDVPQSLVKLNMDAAPNETEMDERKTPLTVTSNYEGIIYCMAYLPQSIADVVTVQYRYGDKDSTFWKKNWTTIKGGESIEFSMNPYTMVQFRAGVKGLSSSERGVLNNEKEQFTIQFGSSEYEVDPEGITIGGSMMSMVAAYEEIDKEWYSSERLTNPYCFHKLFAGVKSEGSYNLEHVTADFLPFKELSDHCYDQMFLNCEGLAEAPALPATRLYVGCYQQMFQGCSALCIAPHLPAIELTDDCYAGMFIECSIISASLAYVGNFDSIYFNNWLPSEYVGQLYYNGLDTKRGSSAIPNNFNVVQDESLIQNKTLDFEVVVDKTTSKLTTNMSKVRAYKDASIKYFWYQIGKLHTNVIEGDDHAYDKAPNGSKIDWDSATTAQEIYDQTTEGKIVPVYGFFPGEISNCANIITNTASFITVRKLANGSQMQYCEVNADDPANETWVDVKEGDFLSFDSHKQIKFQATLGAKSSTSYTNLEITGDVKLHGTVLSLVEDTLGTPATSMPAFGCYKMFEGSTGIKEVGSEFLNVGSDAYMCYANMFKNCSTLTTAPALSNSDSKAKSGEFYHMFDGCVSLQSFGELPFTTMGPLYVNNGTYGAFEGMFANCSALQKVAETSGIQITSPTMAAFRQMFMNCSSLKAAPALTINSAEMYTKDESGEKYAPFAEMFSGCTSMSSANDVNLTFNNASNLVIGPYCFYKMFYNCSKLEETTDVTNPWPNLNTNIAAIKEHGMESMFEECTKLKRVPIGSFNLLNLQSSLTDPITSNTVYGLAGYSLNRMFYNCKALVKPLYMGWIDVGDSHEEAFMHTYMYCGCSSLKVRVCKDRGKKCRPSASGNVFFQCMSFQKGRGSHSSFCDYMFKNIGKRDQQSGADPWDYSDGTPNYCGWLTDPYAYEWFE